ncbi:MAG: DJ-1/PfpI family protein [Chitinophagaceae bacterium]|nr:DJ-1/PfpI family protein [Chitinophagaceae bacterium]
MRNVAIFLFDDVEVLDFAGPFEVFSVCGLRSGAEKPFNVYTVAEKETISARNGLQILPHYQLDNCPAPDIVLLPGGGGVHPDGRGFGTRLEMNNTSLLDWIKKKDASAELMLSVCTGSLLLAKAGLLEGLKATTHWKAVETMKAAAPNTTILPEERWVDNGRIILSAGISAGIDMSLYVISKLLGKEAADETAEYMQYDYWK